MGRRITAERVDQLVAPVLVVWFVLQVALLPSLDHRWAVGLVGCLICAGIAVRRRAPMLVGVLTQLALTLTVDRMHLPAGPVTIAWFSAIYALAVWTPTRAFVVAVPFVLFANAGTLLWREPDSPAANFGLGAAIVMVLVRVAVGGRDRQLRLAERERDVAAREAVVEERARIAREMHDVIAHHVSTMVVQAGGRAAGAAGGPGGDPGGSRHHQRVGRGALTEMRRMVTMVRSETGEAWLPNPPCVTSRSSSPRCGPRISWWSCQDRDARPGAGGDPRLRVRAGDARGVARVDGRLSRPTPSSGR